MTQNALDVVIDNDTTPALRTDLNNVLMDITTLHSGSSQPSSTYANMLWYDTANNILKMSNDTNSGWIDVGYLDQGVGAFRILDDTQVTNSSGTQTGLLGDQATATWEAGTGTTESLVSPAKVKAAVDSFVTSSKVLSATAGASIGAVGTYIWAGTNGQTTFNAGQTYAGSLLVAAGFLSAAGYSDNTAADILGGYTLSGTWRAMGEANIATNRAPTTLFLRVA